MTQANREEESTETSSVDPALKRPAGISYLHMPAVDVREAALFYKNVFGWSIDDIDSDHPSFKDGSGHVRGAWMTDQVVSREPGLLVYIYVEDIDEIVERITVHGGEVVKAVSSEGKLRIARFRDPSGNVLGLWHDDGA